MVLGLVVNKKFWTYVTSLLHRNLSPTRSNSYFNLSASGLSDPRWVLSLIIPIWSILWLNWIPGRTLNSFLNNSSISAFNIEKFLASPKISTLFLIFRISFFFLPADTVERSRDYLKIGLLPMKVCILSIFVASSGSGLWFC